MTYKIYKTYKGKTGLLCVSAFAALCLVFASSLSANTILGQHDWDTTPASGVGNWTTEGDSDVSLSEDTSNGSDHWLKITFDSGIDPGPGSQWYETISVPAADLYTGTWETENWIEFDFWSEDVVPDTLQVRWHGTASDEIWGYTLNPSGVGSWGSYSAPFANWEDWKLNPFVDESDYLADLNSIDWIGVYIFRDGTDEEIYGLDDFGLNVPEPEEYMMLAAALVAAFLALRILQLL